MSSGGYSLRTRKATPAKEEVTEKRKDKTVKRSREEEKDENEAVAKKVEEEEDGGEEIEQGEKGGKRKKAKTTPKSKKGEKGKAVKKESKEEEKEDKEAEEKMLKMANQDEHVPTKEEKEKLHEKLAAVEKKEHTAEEHTHLHVIEKGQVYFFYNPRVEMTHAHSIDDVHKFYLLMRPFKLKDHEHALNRLIIVGHKKLPDIDKREKSWAMIEMADDDIDKIVKTHLENETYHTKTLGDRHLAPARPIGEGLYAILTHRGHSHFVYILEVPDVLGDVQQQFNLESEGSFIISVKNPEFPGKFGQPAHKVDFPKHVKELFEGKRWTSVTTPELLNHSGAELLIVGASDDLHKEFGELGDNLEEQAVISAKSLNASSLLHELKMAKKDHPLAPLTIGVWK